MPRRTNYSHGTISYLRLFFREKSKTKQLNRKRAEKKQWSKTWENCLLNKWSTHSAVENRSIGNAVRMWIEQICKQKNKTQENFERKKNTSTDRRLSEFRDHAQTQLFSVWEWETSETTANQHSTFLLNTPKSMQHRSIFK